MSEQTVNQPIALNQQLDEMSFAANNGVTPEFDWKRKLAASTPEVQEQITALANAIDVTMEDNVMCYGESVLRTTFEECGEFLENEKGSAADQAIVEQLRDLSKKAKDSYDDFDLVLKEPNFIQKVFLAISTGGKSAQHRREKIQDKAVTCYKFLIDLDKYCDSWVEMLAEAMTQIWVAAKSDVENGEMLERYLTAGRIAEERISAEVKVREEKWQNSGFLKDKADYEELATGLTNFRLKLEYLESSRVMYCLSVAELGLIKRSNSNLQHDIRSKLKHNMSIMAQNIRNGMLNEKNREVLEGKKAITRLTDELIRSVAKKIGLTTKETEELVYAGVYNPEVVREAIGTVLTTCEEVRDIATKALPKLKADNEDLNRRLEELERHITLIPTSESATSTTSVEQKPRHQSGGLVF